MTDHRKRRTFLTTAGITVAAGLAGCLGGSDDEGGMDDDGMTEDGMDDGMTEDGTDDGMTESGTDDGMDDENDMGESTDPGEAPRATIDRFGEDAGTLHVRSGDGALPGPGEPIDFDERFLATGFGPDGEVVQYYDFDVMPTEPAPIYAFFHENGDPVEDQLNVVGAIPGDDGYNDFWQVHQVTVPDDYEANTVTSVDGLMDAEFDAEPMDVVKNCPIVPDGSTASLRHENDDSATDLVQGWYDGQVVYYFLFEEQELTLDDGSVPLSPIYVTFNRNPDEEGGGPPSGFATEEDSDQTHNVTATVPGDDGYSPLWSVTVYDNADFEDVVDLDSATDATILESGAATVNCPVVSVGMGG